MSHWPIILTQREFLAWATFWFLLGLAAGAVVFWVVM